MRRLSILFCALVALAAFGHGNAMAQDFMPGAPLVADSGFDGATLAAEGWTEASEGFWTREGRDGAVQKLAFGEGRLQMVPELQAELDRLVGRIGAEPGEKLFGAIDRLTGTLATIHGVPREGAVREKKAALPPSCYPGNLTTSMFTYASPPPGWHGILATASASWDGNGYPCQGHIYARAEYSLTSAAYGNLYDLDWCTADHAYAGDCWAGVNDPWLYDYTSCHDEAYVYLSVANGAVIMSESKESNVCSF